MKIGMKKIFVTLASSILLLGCTDQNARSSLKADPVPVSSFTVTMAANPQRAAEVLGLDANPALPTGNCAKCHGEFKTHDGLNNLSNQTWYAYQCLAGDNTTDKDKLDSLSCLAQLNKALTAEEKAAANEGNVDAITKGINGLEPANLGFFAAATSLPAFQKLFSGNEDNFVTLTKAPWFNAVSMPKSGKVLSEADFQTALTWLMRETPGKDKFLLHDGPQVCASATETFIGAGIKAHVKRMSEDGEGWMAKNQSNGLKMFGCEGNSCFQTKLAGADVFPIVPNILSGAGEVRLLHTLDAKSTYWTRSSADGRYVSWGAKPRSVIVDLMPKLQGKDVHKITVEADYDPAFTPDNLSFMYQGAAHGSRLCNQSMLANASLANIDFNSENCSTTALKIGLYQGLGSSLDSSDIMTINGGFKSDEGQTLVQDTTPIFGENSSFDLSRIRQSESSVFEKVSVKHVETPFIANWMLSPSQKIAIGTVSAATAAKKAMHGGYRLVLTDSAAIAGGALPASLTDSETASLCVGTGEKPQVSFDERYLVYYAYEQHAETVKAAQSSANLFVIDLLGDGKPVQLTNVAKGQFTQFPHFRSDGWLYFDLYNSSTGEREIVATDAILKLQK